MKGIIKDMLKDNIEFYNSILPGKETVRGSKNTVAQFIDAGIYSNIKHSLENKNIENVPLLTIITTDLNRVNKTLSGYNQRSLHDYIITVWYNKPTCTYLISTRDKSKYANNCSVALLGFLNESAQTMMQTIETKMVNNILFNQDNTILLSESKSFIDIMKSIYFSFTEITTIISEKDYKRYDGTDEKNPVYVPNYMLKIMLSIDSSSRNVPYTALGFQKKSLDFDKDIASVSDILISGDRYSNDVFMNKKCTLIRGRFGTKKVLKIVTMYEHRTDLRNDKFIELNFDEEEKTIEDINKKLFESYVNPYTMALSKAIYDDCKDYFERYEIFRLLFYKEEYGEISVTRDRHEKSLLDDDHYFRKDSLNIVKQSSDDYLSKFSIITDKYLVLFGRTTVLFDNDTKGYRAYTVKIVERYNFDRNVNENNRLFCMSEKLIDCVAYFVNYFYDLKDINHVINKIYDTISKDWITEIDNSNVVDNNLIEYNMRHTMKSAISLMHLNIPIDSIFKVFDDDPFNPFSDETRNTLHQIGHYLKEEDVKKIFGIELDYPLIRINYNNWMFLSSELEDGKNYTVPSVFLSTNVLDDRIRLDGNYGIKLNDGKLKLYTSEKFPISDGTDRTFLMSDLEKACIKKFLVSSIFKNICTKNLEAKKLSDGLLVMESTKKPILQRICEFLETLGSLEDINDLLLTSEGLHLDKNDKGIFRVNKLSKKIYNDILKGKEDPSKYNIFSKNYVRPRIKGGK